MAIPLFDRSEACGSGTRATKTQRPPAKTHMYSESPNVTQV